MTSELLPGDLISFSAGDRSVDDCAFRIIRQGDDRLMQVIQHFPHLQSVLQTTPLIVNCYPAFLGRFASAVTCDTYLRHATFQRSLLLACKKAMPTIILGQPLVLADLLLCHVAKQLSLPSALVICVGGYFCPKSLETHIRAVLTQNHISHVFLHAYGVAEVDFAVFVGERTCNIHPLYRHVAPHVEYRTGPLGLELRLFSSDDGWHSTGDLAENKWGGIEIVPGNRLAPEVHAALEAWTGEDWTRRTGYIARGCDGLAFQLRQQCSDVIDSSYEIDYWAFCRRFSRSFPEKPDWSLR